MEQRRKTQRLKVQLPISCMLTGRGQQRRITSTGFVQDLSTWGMRVSLPVPLKSLGSTAVDYSLKLPKPFQPIQGNGRIRWAYWDESQRLTTFGMEISPLDQDYRRDMDTILSELSEELV